jgi:membrane glycosyltransferase
LGISTGACLLRISDTLALWLAPVWLGWALAVPIAALLASRGAGARLRRAGLLASPAEAGPPEVIRRAVELSTQIPQRPSTFVERFESIVSDPWLNDVHVGLLAASSRRDRPGHVVDPLVVRALESGLADLSTKEAMTLLSHPTALRSLHLARIMHQQKEGTEGSH